MLLRGAVQQLVGFALPDLKMVVHRIQPAAVVIREFQCGDMILHAVSEIRTSPMNSPAAALYPEAVSIGKSLARRLEGKKW